MVEIVEQTNIQPEQYNQFLPKQKFNIPKSTIQKVKSTITSLNSGLVGDKTFQTSASTPFTFVVNPNNQTVIDLSQAYFNVAGKLKIPTGITGLKSTDIKFGNLFLSSLFQQMSLSIGGTVIALNANPGIDANIQASLKFDQYDLVNKTVSDRQFMLNQLSQAFEPGKETMVWSAGYFVIEGTFPATAANGNFKGHTAQTHESYSNMTFIYDGVGIQLDTSSGNFTGCTNLIITFDDRGNGYVSGNFAGLTGQITANSTSAEWTVANSKVYSMDDGFENKYTDVIPNCTIDNAEQTIPFRCKFYLSDMFNYTVDSLDYIFNREISITLQRGSTNFIIANPLCGDANDLTIEVDSLSKFDLVIFSYLLTDTAKQQLLSYYSKPVETLFGVQTTNLTPLYNTVGNGEQNITLPLTVNYDTKCILLAFPKCSNALTKLNTPKSWDIVSQVPNGDGNQSKKYQASWFASNSNSYNFAGLKYIRISNTSNSNIYTYDFQGTQLEAKNIALLEKSYDISNVAAGGVSTLLDYRESYEQFKQIRLLFGKDPDNGISYSNYLKDYCVIPIDLTGSNIPPNTRIFITFQFAFPQGDYNPLFFGNMNTKKQLTTNILAVFLGSDVLQYNPDGTCIVKHILSGVSNEKNVVIK